MFRKSHTHCRWLVDSETKSSSIDRNNKVVCIIHTDEEVTISPKANKCWVNYINVLIITREHTISERASDTTRLTIYGEIYCVCVFLSKPITWIFSFPCHWINKRVHACKMLIFTEFRIITFDFSCIHFSVHRFLSWVLCFLAYLLCKFWALDGK